MTRIYMPSSSAEDWKQFLAEPDKQWKRGYSARSLAYCWQEADGIPEDVQRVFSRNNDLTNLEALFVVPEHQVHLPGGKRPSQNDVWVLARNKTELVSIAVEGKVSEPFGPTLDEWDSDSSKGKQERYQYLCKLLGLETDLPGDIRYQLIHRTASAVIEANRFMASRAVMLVHTFSQTHEWFEDYARFISLFGVSSEVDDVVSVGEVSGVSLYFAWVQGDKRYLDA